MRETGFFSRKIRESKNHLHMQMSMNFSVLLRLQGGVSLMCTAPRCAFKLQVLHRDPSGKIDPGGLVKKAEQTVHFLQEAEEKPLSVSLWGHTSSSADWKRLQNILSAEQRIISCPLPFLEAHTSPGDPATNMSCLTCWPLERARKQLLPPPWHANSRGKSF